MKIAKTSYNLIVGLVLFSIVLIGGATSEMYSDTAHKIKVKPDIRFHKVDITRTGITASKAHRIRIKVSVRNFSRVKTCTGPFKIRVEWRNSGRKQFALLREVGVAKLCYDPARIKLDIATRTIDHIVQPGKTNTYKITIDPQGQVLESNDSNNIMLKKYKADRMIARIDNRTAVLSIEDRLPSCDGIDLIVKGVEVIRTDSGNIFIKATIKNLCEGSCTGPIIIEVDESDVLGRPGGVTQPISNGIGSKAEFTMFSALGIVNDSSRVCTYIVSVKSEGGCIEPAAKRGNNTFSITVNPL